MAADGRRFHARGAAEAEVVQHEVQTCGVAACVFKVLLDPVLDGVTQSGHGGREPVVHEHGLGDVRQEREARIRVDGLEQGNARLCDRSFRQRPDLDRQLAFVLAQHQLPARLVEDGVVSKVSLEQGPSLVEHGLVQDFADEVVLDDALQSDEGEQPEQRPLAALAVGFDVLCSDRVLQGVADLVAVGLEQEVVAESCVKTHVQFPFSRICIRRVCGMVWLIGGYTWLPAVRQSRSICRSGRWLSTTTASVNASMSHHWMESMSSAAFNGPNKYLTANNVVMTSFSSPR